MSELRSPQTEAGARLLTDLTDLDTTGAAPTSMFLGPHGVRRAILAIEDEAASGAVTETPEGLDVDRLERALWAAEIWDEDEGFIGPMPEIAAKIAAAYAHKEEHGD